MAVDSSEAFAALDADARERWSEAVHAATVRGDEGTVFATGLTRFKALAPGLLVALAVTGLNLVAVDARER